MEYKITGLSSSFFLNYIRADLVRHMKKYLNSYEYHLSSLNEFHILRLESVQSPRAGIVS